MFAKKKKKRSFVFLNLILNLQYLEYIKQNPTLRTRRRFFLFVRHRRRRHGISRTYDDVIKWFIFSLKWNKMQWKLDRKTSHLENSWKTLADCKSVLNDAMFMLK